MFGPFGQPKLPGFNIRLEDSMPGFRVEPSPRVPGFNVDSSTADAVPVNPDNPYSMGAMVPVADKPGTGFTGVPPAQNDNRHDVCQTAAFNCLDRMSELPSERRATAREACMKAENLCNFIIGLTRTGPFPSGVVIRFPDGSHVEIPPGSTGGASYVPAPPNYRIP